MIEKQDESMIELEDLEYYVVMGVTKDGREPVTVVSPNTSLLDLGGMMGRLQATFELQTVQAGMYNYSKHAETMKRQAAILNKGVVGGATQ
jgi:hypothetical protein